MNCVACDWNLEPGLAEAIAGFIECTNCGVANHLPLADRVEIAQDFEQRLHVLER